MSNQSPKANHTILRKFGIFLLTFFLVVGSFLGFLYYTITTNIVTVDDPVAQAAQAPIPASRRFVFDAANETAQIRLEKSDLWWLLLPKMEENILENVNRELENYQLSVTGYGFHITEKGLCIDLEAMYQSLRLPVHILTSLDFDSSGCSVTLDKVKLGAVRLPVAGFLPSINMQLDVDWPVVTDITSVDYQQNAIELTGTLTQDMLSCVQDACQNDEIGWFSTDHQAIFRAARETDGFRELLAELEQNPGSVESLYHDMFTLAEGYEYDDFMNVSQNLSHRFFPGIDFSARETENDAVRRQWGFCDTVMDELVTQVSSDFNNRRFSLKNGAFYLRGSEFDPLHYLTGDRALKIQQLFQVIDQDRFHLVIVGSISGYSVKSPVLNRICSKDQQLTQELNRNTAYPVGCVFQGRNGDYVLRYESIKISGSGNQMSKWLKTETLSEAEYDALIQEGKIGVWIS